MQNSSRIAWIDEFKGLVLLLVCIFHVDQHFQNIDVGSFHLACLRMAAFFFISGVLFSDRRFPKFKDYFVHKTKVLLLPYVSLSFLFLLLDPVIYNFDLYPKALKTQMFFQPVLCDSVWKYIAVNLENVFVEGKGSLMASTLWFVSTLYFISLIFYLLQKFATWISVKSLHENVVKNSVIGFVAAASFTAGYVMCLHKIHLPLGIERDLSTFFYFALGFMCKGALKHCNAFAGSKFKLSLPCIAAVCFVAYAFLKDPSPWRGFYNNNISLLLLASSIFGIAGLIALMSFLSGFKGKPVQVLLGVLRCVSRNGLIVLTVHFWTLITLKILFKQFFDRPVIAYSVYLIVAVVTFAAIPLFRCKLYRLLGKEKVSAKESLSIK